MKQGVGLGHSSSTGSSILVAQVVRNLLESLPFRLQRFLLAATLLLLIDLFVEFCPPGGKMGLAPPVLASAGQCNAKEYVGVHGHPRIEVWLCGSGWGGWVVV